MTVNKNVLIVVDAQFDFCEGGALATVGASETCRKISDYLWDKERNYSEIILSKDWHITPEEHFIVWPKHCVAGSSGSNFHWTIQDWYNAAKEDTFFSGHVNTFLKGKFDHGYSAWEAIKDRGQVYQTTAYQISNLVQEALNNKETVNLTIDVCGLVTEHCVKATVLDALKTNHSSLTRTKMTVRLLEDLVQAYDPELGARAIDEMYNAGAVIG